MPTDAKIREHAELIVDTCFTVDKGDTVTIICDDEHAKQHRRDGSDRVGLEQVGTHTGAVAHVVSNVVCDYSGVARVVFRYASFHFPDEVCTNVCGFRVDASADAGKQ